MTKSDLLTRLGKDSRFLDFDLYTEAQSPGVLGGRPFDRAYMGYDFVGFSRVRKSFLLVNSWESTEERLFEVAQDGSDRPRPLLPAPSSLAA